MEYVVNIYEQRRDIDLNAGKYRIDVLGGWGVTLGQFAISLKHISTGQVVDCEKVFWPVQSFAFGKRSRRIFVVRIAQPGMYEIQFRNPAALKVKSTNLIFSRRFQEPLPADQISIYIH